MLPAQKQFWDLSQFTKLLVGGFGSGKTHIGAMRALYLSYANQGLPGMYISPSYPMARKTIEVTLKDMLDRAGISYRYNQKYHEYSIWNWNGSIWIGSGDDPDSLKGPNLAWVGIDEPFIQDKAVYHIALSRVRHPAAKQSELFMTGTPEDLNWGYDLAIGKGGDDVGVVHARTRDNVHIPERTIQAMESAYTDEMIDAYLNGKFVNLTSGRVYPAFDRSRNVVTRNDLSGFPVIVGMDFNVAKMCASVGYQTSDGVHWFDEIVLRNSNTFEMAEVLAGKYPGSVVYPDPAGSARKTSATKSDHQILAKAGFTVRAHKKHPPIRERVNSVNALWHNSKREVKMTVDPKCTEIIEEMDRTQWKNGAPDEGTDHERTHMGDAVGYPVEYLFGLSRKRIHQLSRYA